MEAKDKYKHSQTGAFTVREFDIHKDYKEYSRWYQKICRSNPPKPDSLSTLGIIIEHQQEKICAGFLYITNSDIALIEFVIANPDAKGSVRKESLKKLLTQLEDEANYKGYKVLLILTSNAVFGENLAKNFNYKKGDTPHYEYIKEI